tara:strand:- start:401 stop:817 length:417 start_codon:yes stop_codon:yes gene_type:complete
MSKLKTNTIRHNDASVDSLTLASTGVATFGAAAIGEVGTLSSSGNATAVNLAVANLYNLALSENTTVANPTGDVEGQSGSIFITQDGTGSRTAAWGSHYLWAGGTAPTLTTTGNAVDRIDYVVAAADKIHCVASLDVK